MNFLQQLCKSQRTLGFMPACQRYLFTNAHPSLFRITDSLYAEPLKKKKKMDPSILKAREERKKKKLEKEIRRLEKVTAQLKPLEEIEVPLELKNDIEKRSRPSISLTEDEVMYQSRLNKQWCQYKLEQHNEDLIIINNALKSKIKALEELKLESEELYFEAIQFDLSLIPFRCKGPVSTPPIQGFEPVDGDYVDTTRKWE